MSRPALTSLTFASTDALTSVADLLGRTLGLVFEPRSSDWRGGDYFLAGDWRTAYAELVYVQRNDDLGEPAEPEYAAYPTLVYVECTRRADHLEQAVAITDLVFVRREDWDDPRDSAATSAQSP
ncbi:hypothetical protein ACIBL3_04500 [Kribbella sp. NPDC050124]|uniref:hypothetical protein n=1 Tax=Kribbella sp. NPDC050124 TaxID=3364114 RepID=UPI00379884A6